MLLLVGLSVLWAAFFLAGAFLLATHTNNPLAHGEVMDMFKGWFHLQDPPQTLAAPWFAEGLLAAALSTLVIARSVLWLDRRRCSTRALLWSLRTIPCLLAWTLVAGTSMALIVDLGSANWTSGVAFGIAIAYFLTLPFLFMRSDVIALDRPPSFWLPRWPGLPTVVLAIVAVTIWFGGGSLLPDVDLRQLPKALLWFLALAAGLVAWILGLMLYAYVLRSWLHRLRWSELAAGFRPTELLARARVLAALDLQLLWMSVWLLLPLLLWVPATLELSASYLEPIAKAQYRHSGHLSFPVSGLVDVSRFAVSYWWMILMVMCAVVSCWLLLTTRARALHLAEATEDSAHA
jgi:hypothetical protein